MQKKEFSVAPMMDWTDRHCRTFHRLLAPNAVLYTEMVTAPAILHGNQEKLLGFGAFEQPLVLQLGGSDPEQLYKASAIAKDFGYRELNLNCGCPSDRVQKGRFGACLMEEPELVAECVIAMREGGKMPATVKCRIAIDEAEPEPFLSQFLGIQIEKAKLEHVIVHARKAWLKGLSPKENRDIPPLDYSLVNLMKERFPQLTMALNGGISDLETAMEWYTKLDGIMIGRAAYHSPLFLRELQIALYPETQDLKTEAQVISAMADYMEHAAASGIIDNPHSVTRHMLGMFAGQRGAKRWRQELSQFYNHSVAQAAHRLREWSAFHAGTATDQFEVNNESLI